MVPALEGRVRRFGRLGWKLLLPFVALLLSSLYLLRGPVTLLAYDWYRQREWDQRFAEVGRRRLPRLEKGVQDELTSFLEGSGLLPRDYLVASFEDHDIVFVGEFHRIRWQVELVRGAIPALHRAGVHNLGFEFARPADQEAIDSCLVSPTFDRAAAHRFLFDFLATWCYREYADIFEAAWRLNRSLPPGSPEFRIVALTHEGSGEEKWAQTLLGEVIEKGEKALVFCGINHGLTRFEQPYRTQTGEYGFVKNRCGQHVYRAIGARAFTICLHQPSTTPDGSDYVYPVDGVIDALLAQLPPERRRVGFDTRGTPFGRLTDRTSRRANGRRQVRLEDMYDGYICQGLLSECRSVTIIPNWLNDDNFADALEHLIPPHLARWSWVARLLGPETMSELIAYDADIEQRFRIFE